MSRTAFVGTLSITALFGAAVWSFLPVQDLAETIYTDFIQASDNVADVSEPATTPTPLDRTTLEAYKEPSPSN